MPKNKSKLFNLDLVPEDQLRHQTQTLPLGAYVLLNGQLGQVGNVAAREDLSNVPPDLAAIYMAQQKKSGPQKTIKFVSPESVTDKEILDQFLKQQMANAPAQPQAQAPFFPNLVIKKFLGR